MKEEVEKKTVKRRGVRAIKEALEIEISLLFMDEDTCVTNFMIKDARVKAGFISNKEYP